MIQMETKQEILHKYRVERKSLRSIAREMHLNRKTVTRIVREYESAVAQDPQNGLGDYLSQKPTYHPRPAQIRVMTEMVTNEIDRWLAENVRRRQCGLKKQCLKRQDIHRALVESGYPISYSSVCKYIQKKEEQKASKPKDAHIKRYHEPGMECEFDWGEVKLCIHGKMVTFTMAVFALCHSEGRWAYLFRHQDNLAFMESHRNFFRDVQGVPHTMVYDNMRVAVILGGKEKKPTQSLQRMTNYYGYAYRFCNARAGWEKGSVERSVDYVRGRAFTTRLDFDSIEEAQDWLDTICVQINKEHGSVATLDKESALERDLHALLPYPGEIGCFELTESTVDKQSTIWVKNNHYSVPDHLVGKQVFVQLYSEKIVVKDNDRQTVATHERSYSRNEWVIDINHYITTLLKKPGAIENSLAMRQMPIRMQELYRVHFRDNGREFIRLLKHCQEYSYTYDDIMHAVSSIRQRGARHINYDQIKVALETKDAPNITYLSSQQTDQFLEIELGSEDVLSQLDTIMQGRAAL